MQHVTSKPSSVLEYRRGALPRWKLKVLVALLFANGLPYGMAAIWIFAEMAIHGVSSREDEIVIGSGGLLLMAVAVVFVCAGWGVRRRSWNSGKLALVISILELFVFGIGLAWLVFACFFGFQDATVLDAISILATPLFLCASGAVMSSFLLFLLLPVLKEINSLRTKQ